MEITLMIMITISIEKHFTQGFPCIKIFEWKYIPEHDSNDTVMEKKRIVIDLLFLDLSVCTQYQG